MLDNFLLPSLPLPWSSGMLTRWWYVSYLGQGVCFHIKITYSLPRASWCSPGRDCVTGKSTYLVGIVAEVLGFSDCVLKWRWQWRRSVMRLYFLGPCADLSVSPLSLYSLGSSRTIQEIQPHICPTPFATGRGKCVGRISFLPKGWIIISPLTCSKIPGYE